MGKISKQRDGMYALVGVEYADDQVLICEAK